MNISKALNRERKINKRRNGMQVDNRNIFILEEEKRKRAIKIKREREQKEQIRSGKDA